MDAYPKLQDIDYKLELNNFSLNHANESFDTADLSHLQNMIDPMELLRQFYDEAATDDQLSASISQVYGGESSKFGVNRSRGRAFKMLSELCKSQLGEADAEEEKTITRRPTLKMSSNTPQALSKDMTPRLFGLKHRNETFSYKIKEKEQTQVDLKKQKTGQPVIAEELEELENELDFHTSKDKESFKPQPMNMNVTQEMPRNLEVPSPQRQKHDKLQTESFIHRLVSRGHSPPPKPSLFRSKRRPLKPTYNIFF